MSWDLCLAFWSSSCYSVPNRKNTTKVCVREQQDGGREIEDKEGNIQTERGLENNRERERGREKEGIEKKVAKL